MSDANVLPAAAFAAIAVAQATYGVPDRLIAKIAQCSVSQILRNRKRVGWSMRKVSLAYLRGQDASASTMPDGRGDPDGLQTSAKVEGNGDVNIDALKAVIERLLLRLSNLLSVENPEDLDPMMPKQIEAIGVALKHIEKVKELRSALDGSLSDQNKIEQKDPVETARVLRKIEKRVYDLAERRARDIISGGVDARRGSDS